MELFMPHIPRGTIKSYTLDQLPDCKYLNLTPSKQVNYILPQLIFNMGKPLRMAQTIQ
jgi:hypothetical protein